MSFVKAARYIRNQLNELGFTAQSRSEAMLLAVEKVAATKKAH